jgi:hypothetical protein
MIGTSKIRNAIFDAIPPEGSNYGESPELGQIYIPNAHLKALRPEANLVIGSRGVGKSFWTTTLSEPKLRSAISSDIDGLTNMDVSVCFAFKSDIDTYPDANTFAKLMHISFTPYEIWRTVVIKCLSINNENTIPCDSWEDSVRWVKENPELTAKFFQLSNDKLKSTNTKKLLLFDALDRCSDDWHVMDEIVRDLLRFMLELKSFPLIYTKVFLREDQFSRTVTDFPDASKLLATKAELIWHPHDLHGLLWQLLCNANKENGEILRNVYRETVGKTPYEKNGAWMLREETRHEGRLQRALFEKLAGRWMGSNSRRGATYNWSVNHLADGKGRTSPRSFLLAIREAAENSREEHQEWTLPLHYESIKRGVQKASSIRIDEMAEDYPWIKKMLQPLEGLNVPCEFSKIEGRWKELFVGDFGEVISKMREDRLPPQHTNEGWKGIREDLERLGVFVKMNDDRVNMPDLYRVASKLGRLGGVKPIDRG